MRNPYKLLSHKREGKTTLSRPRHGWEDNIEMELREMRFEGVDYSQRVKDSVH
jgi:hypothetical protein